MTALNFGFSLRSREGSSVKFGVSLLPLGSFEAGVPSVRNPLTKNAILARNSSKFE